jgi:hypothetical protein
VWPQGNSVGLTATPFAPQPDVTVLRRRDDLYAGTRPGPENVLLLVEVSDSTLKFDRGGKLQLYAEARIPEYWIANLVDGVAAVYRAPHEGTYSADGPSSRIVAIAGRPGGQQPGRGFTRAGVPAIHPSRVLTLERRYRFAGGSRAESSPAAHLFPFLLRHIRLLIDQ